MNTHLAVGIRQMNTLQQKAGLLDTCLPLALKTAYCIKQKDLGQGHDATGVQANKQSCTEHAPAACATRHSPPCGKTHTMPPVPRIALHRVDHALLQDTHLPPVPRIALHHVLLYGRLSALLLPGQGAHQQAQDGKSMPGQGAHRQAQKSFLWRGQSSGCGEFVGCTCVYFKRKKKSPCQARVLTGKLKGFPV
eukprot:428407-Pelagomonas_calceolata.AAC.1